MKHKWIPVLKKIKESLFQAEEDWPLWRKEYQGRNRKDSDTFMKPKFKVEIKKLKDRPDEMEGPESNYS
jgi:hypothetical protein